MSIRRDFLLHGASLAALSAAGLSLPARADRPARMHWITAVLGLVGMLELPAMAAPQASTCNAVSAARPERNDLLRVGPASVLLVDAARLRDAGRIKVDAIAARATALLAVDAQAEPAGADRHAELPLLRVATETPRSSVLFSGGASLRVAALAVDGRAVRLLLRIQQGGPQLVAKVAGAPPRARGSEVQWTPVAASDPSAAQANMRALEHLYQLVLEQEPDQPFSFQIGASSPRRNLAYGDVLKLIVQARECFTAEVARSTAANPPKTWEVAAIEPAATPRRGPLEVAARARDASGRPVSGAQIAFARGQHLVCGAQTDASGVAACKLWDPHGHATDDEEHTSPATIASFSGVVHAHRILLPTAALLSATRIRHRH